MSAAVSQSDGTNTKSRGTRTGTVATGLIGTLASSGTTVLSPGGSASTTLTLTKPSSPISGIATNKISNAQSSFSERTAYSTRKSNTVQYPTENASSAGSSHSPSASADSATGSSSPSAASSQHDGYTAASLAGGIIGAAIGAAIITFLATYLLCGRKNRRRAPRAAFANHSSTRSQRQKSLKGAVAVAEKPTSQVETSSLGWQAYLPQSMDDGTVMNAVKTLFDQVDLHVDNYYSRMDVNIDENVKADLNIMSSDKLPASVDQMMSNPRTSMPVIKHCIANMLVSKIIPGENASRSLLPTRLALAPPILGQSSMPAGEHRAAQQVYSQWRRLNAYLFPAERLDSADQRRLQNVSNELSDAMFLAFMPWQAHGQDDEAVKQHERSLMTKASELGQLILAQPSGYQFEWSGVHGAAQWCMFPGFWKMSEENGRELDSPQPLVAPIVINF